LKKSFSLYTEFKSSLARAVAAAAQDAFGLHLPDVSIEKPARPENGDFSSPLAFDLAKSLRRPPRKIAEDLAARLRLPAGLDRVSVEGGGYLNFFLDRGKFAELFFCRRAEEDSPKVGEKVIVEHTNINPNKAAHIGHLRNAVLGDTLVRCLRARGSPVEVQNYIDDTGVQVADVVVGFVDFEGCGIPELEERIRQPRRGEKLYSAFGDLCWDVYADVGREYESRPETKGLRASTLHAIEEGGTLRSTAAELISQAIVREHVATMGRIGVAYDLLPRESDILKKHFWTRAFELLRARHAVTLETEGKHAGCWVMRLSAAEDFAGMDEPDKILVRSNGTVTYTGKDIAYQLWKLGRLGLDFDYAPFEPDWNAGRGGAEAVPEEIRAHAVWQTSTGSSEPSPGFGSARKVFNVIDVRQSYPQKVVREGLRAVGFESEAEASIHFAYEMVALTPATARRLAEAFGGEYTLSEEDEKKAFVEMSGRKGQGVKAHDLLEAMVDQAAEQVREREPELDSAILRTRARVIASGALRYFMLKFGRNKIIAFDFDEALNFEGDTGPYLQYSAVRADNIFRKLEDHGVPSTLLAEDLSALSGGSWDDDLWEIFLESSRITEIVERALATLEFSALARHAFTLAQAFSHFYHQHPILAEKNETLRKKRLAAAIAFRDGLGCLLSLLGIPTAEKM
jgi:arginyl-tRNA synthetase